MAVRQHNQSRVPLPAASRRDVLAAALAVPLAAARHPGLGSHQSTTLMGSLDPGSSPDAAGQTTSWTLNQVQGDGGEESFVVTKWDRALARYRAAEAALAAVSGTEDDDLYDRHLLRFNAALKKLLRTPGPATGLVLKLELTIEHLAWELTGGERCMAALLEDARSLSRA